MKILGFLVVARFVRKYENIFQKIRFFSNLCATFPEIEPELERIALELI
nr:hypothetical protein [Streptococcus gallolyticus]